MTDKWSDDVTRGIDYTHNLLDFMRNERSQLYGSLVYVMLKSDLPSCEITAEELREIGKTKYILFSPNEEEQKIKIEVLDREDGNPEE